MKPANSKLLSIFYISLIVIGIISIILMYLDRQHFVIYGEIVLFVAFLTFLFRGIESVKSAEYTSAIMNFSVVLIYIGAEILKILWISDTL